MKAIINKKEYELDKEEMEFVQSLRGPGVIIEGVMHFDTPRFISVGELAEYLGCTIQAIHERNAKDPKRFQIHSISPKSAYIWEWELPIWKEVNKANRNK